MEQILQLTPAQSAFILAFNLWLFVIFPVIVIRKLNHISALLEAQFYPEEQGE